MATAYTDKVLIEEIKKKINRKILCEAVKFVYDFLKEYDFKFSDCIRVCYEEKYLTRQNFYGKALIRYASDSSGQRSFSNNSSHYYLICNKECKKCKNKIKCGMDFNGFIYQYEIGGMFNDIG